MSKKILTQTLLFYLFRLIFANQKSLPVIMKKLFFFLVFIFPATIVFAQTDSANSNAAKNEPANILDTAAMAKVYVIRSTGHVGSAVNLRMLVNDSMLCKIRNNRYAVLYVKPGTHMFNATSWDKPASKDKFGLTVPVEAGKDYYFSMRIKTRFMNTEIFLEEITLNTAAPLLQKYKQDQCD